MRPIFAERGWQIQDGHNRRNERTNAKQSSHSCKLHLFHVAIAIGDATFDSEVEVPSHLDLRKWYTTYGGVSIAMCY